MTWWALILVVYALIGAFHVGGVVALETFVEIHPEHQPEGWKDDRPPMWFIVLVSGVFWPTIWRERREGSDEQHLN